ncbi:MULTISPECIES: FmdE family protein [Methanobacterium]|uniref:Formylmethanofuran dehydrogenase n=1 Tax=Methanobacterium bryantii TaxID=2161 RepID=A0A2A2H0W5_METBR|nr:MULTISPECIES: FmdE family protein [Methanobacterium]OEC86377.1 formylmethanofuran dehydrogenase [Methanobacterium sp. A39]PAV03038.1 formylmethanofuran dehydrogenase [Methanobacterium bryantii]
MGESIQILPFSEVTKFHGHVCPGTAIGYRASEIAIKELGSDRAIDEEFLAIVENDSCSVDAIQVVTGCTIGKGNLIFKDHGKNVYSFVNRKTGDTLRLSLKMSIDEMDPEFAEIREKAFSGSASEEEKSKFEEKKDKASFDILDMPDAKLFKIEHVKIEIPEEARIFQSVKCAKCGEMVAEHRARVENGKIVCIPCFNDYSRT